MYAAHFGLAHAPFSIAPDPRFLFMSERHREALAHLLYGLQAGGGFVLLTGEIGAGKTTVCRCFLEQVPETCRVAYIFNPKLSVIELLQTVCDEFGVAVAPRGAGQQPTVKDHIDPLNRFLLEAHAQGRQCVLVIDEAQNLDAQVLEQLRLLTNLETGERKLLQIILIGQPELRTLLAQPALEQLAQRVIARYHLGALSRDETLAYLQHRMSVAGRSGPLPFDRAALARIHALTGGVPRRINLLADRALLGAYVERRASVSRAIVDRAAAEVFVAQATAAVAGWRRPGWAVGALAMTALVAVAAGLAWQAGRMAQGTGQPLDRAARAAPGASAAASALASAPASATASAAAATAAPAASATAAAATPLPRFDAATDWPELLADEPAAWAALASHWAPVGGGTALCGAGSAWQCHRGTQMSLAMLRLLDRPGWLTLRDPAGSPGRSGRALLLGLDGQRAQLGAGARRWAIDTGALVQLWQGDFATFWQAPPGYEQPLKPGDQGPVVRTLIQALQRVQGMADADTPQPADHLGPRWSRQLLAFQRAQGLAADGVAGPTTFMQLNRALGVAEPRLADRPAEQPTARPAEPTAH